MHWETTSHDVLWSSFGLVPSTGYSGVSCLALESPWPRKRPLLLTSGMTSCPHFVYSGDLSSLLLLGARLGALPRGAAAAAWPSTGRCLSACCCALCATRASRNPSIKLATNLAWASPASLFGTFFLLFISLEGTISSAGEAVAAGSMAMGGFGSVLELLGLWICLWSCMWTCR